METKTCLEYELLDCGNFKKLEKIGDLKIVRPAAGALWSPQSIDLWKDVDMEFERSKTSEGKWKHYTQKKFPLAAIKCGPQLMHLQPTGFGHMGLFAEQISYWKKIINICKESSLKDLRVLNLFAYTGGSSVASALGGAKVVHLDASKTSVEWAKKNAHSNHLENANLRWIVDDVVQFVKKEIRRDNKYHGIILDPPSYGRGPKNQLWKIEEHLPPLIKDLTKILAEDFLFFHLSAHTPGVTALSLENLLKQELGSDYSYFTEEMSIASRGGTSLPSGASCWVQKL